MPNKTQRFSIDLERNAAVAKVAADVEPGDKLEATVSVVSKDDKTLVIELEELGDSAMEAEAEEDKEEESDDAESPITQALGRD